MSLTGSLSPCISNLTFLSSLNLSENNFRGKIPQQVGYLFRLRSLDLSINAFEGEISVNLSYCSHLRVMLLSNNNLTGKIFYGYNISELSLNFLGNNASRDLGFMESLSNCTGLEKFSMAYNNFGVSFPSCIANMSNLGQLHIAGNQIYGKIQSGIGNLVNLYLLSMQWNLFSGRIPDSLGNLVKLQLLNLSGNKFSGEIPRSLCNITQLTLLYLALNELEGNLSSIGNCRNLQHLSIDSNRLNTSLAIQNMDLFAVVYLNLSQNALTGHIPLEVDNLISTNMLDVSENKLSGKIPQTIGECSSLIDLRMRGNKLQGDIPSSLAFLKGLEVLDLSSNNLSGNIPRELENLMFLQYLNFSFNNFKGEAPRKGVFSNFSAFSLYGNEDLCGGIPELRLPACYVQGKKHRNSTTAIILAAIFSPTMIPVAIISWYVFHKTKSRKDPSSSIFYAKLPQVSYKELLEATNAFSSKNIIGEVSFGSVYRGNLDPEGEKLVAVKVLKLQLHGASKSFLAECKALCNIRHRNLVKILTCCSSIDFKGNEFKALVFDFMANGSLEMWLHPKEDDN